MATWIDRVDARAPGAEAQITGEEHTVGEDTANFVFLHEVPLEESPSSVLIPGFVEVTGSPGVAEFRVYYSGRLAGAVEFHPSANGQEISVTYKGRGSALFARDINRLQREKADTTEVAPVGSVILAPEGLNLGPKYVPADGGIALQDTYPQLFEKIGLRGIGGRWDVLVPPGAGSINGIAVGASAVIMSPNDANNRFILRSLDGGASWHRVDLSGIATTALSFCASDGLNTFMVISGSRILRSTDSGASWEIVQDFASGTLTFIRHGNGVWLTFCTSDAFYRSTDNGATWEQATAPQTTQAYQDAAYGNGRWVAVGLSGVSAYSTTDGASWTAGGTIGASQNATCVDYGNGTFVTGTNNGLTLASVDGVGWTHQVSHLASSFYVIAFADGIFVAGGENGRYSISTNGQSWTQKEWVAGSTQIRAAGFVNGRWVLGGGSGAAAYSEDGFDTTQLVWTWPSTSGSINDAAQAGDTIIVTGSNPIRIVRSGDGGRTFELINAPSIATGASVATNGQGTWVIVCTNGTVWRSTDDGLTWGSGSLGVTTNDAWVIYAKGMFYACTAAAGSGTIRRSPDGSSWTQVYSNASNGVYGLVYAEDRFVAVGQNGTVLYSLDGATWRAGDAIGQVTGGYLYTVTYHHGRFYTGGSAGFFGYSTDGGITWHELPTPGDASVQFRRLLSVEEDGLLVLCGSGRALLSRDNGQTWVNHAFADLYLPNSGTNVMCAAKLSDMRILVAASSTAGAIAMLGYDPDEEFQIPDLNARAPSGMAYYVRALP